MRRGPHRRDERGVAGEGRRDDGDERGDGIGCRSRSLHLVGAGVGRRAAGEHPRDPGREGRGAGVGGAAVADRALGHGGDAVPHLVGAVGGDLLEAVRDGAVRESGDQRGAVPHVLDARRQHRGGFAVEPVDERSAGGVGDGVGDRRVPGEEAGVREDRVRAVEQPQLAELPRLDVVDEPGAGALPVGTPGREVARQHPVAERLGDDRCGVEPAVGLDGGDAGRLEARRDAVDRGADERHGPVDPVEQRAAEQGGDAPDAAAQALAVLRHVVARHDGDGRAAREAAGVECDDEAHERRARPGTVQAARGGEAASEDAEIGGDGGVVEVGGAVVPEAVADLGDRERDDRDGVIGEQLLEAADVGAVVRGDDARDDLDAVAVGSRSTRE